MGVPARLESVASLYPIRRDDNAAALVQGLLTGEHRGDGKPIIKRLLTTEERDALVVRKRILSEALQSGGISEIKNVVIEMLLGFNKTASRNEAAAIAAQYVKVLQSLPLWAVKRACGKFERGEVVDGIDGIAKMIVDSKGPTTAQIYPVAKAMVDVWYLELTNVQHCLTGVVLKDIPPEMRERVKHGLAELAEAMKMKFFERREVSSGPFMTDDQLRAHYAPKDGKKKRERKVA